jgi:hypothetical protein
MRWLMSTLEVYETQDRHQPVTVLSEGVAQRSLLGFVDAAGRVDYANLSRYLTSVPRPHVLVKLDIPLDAAQARLQRRSTVEDRVSSTPDLRRPKARLDLERPELNRFLAQAQQVIRHAVSELQARGTKVLPVDVTNGEDLDRAVNALAREVRLSGSMRKSE